MRAYAPAVPHTTTRQGLSCAACHDDPQVLGFGRGKLTPRAGGDRPSWEFESAYETSTYDRRPADAWIGALDGSVGVSTRKSARSLTVEEQRRVLTVGACLPCHEPAKSAELYRHFDESLKKMLPQCGLYQPRP